MMHLKETHTHIKRKRKNNKNQINLCYEINYLQLEFSGNNIKNEMENVYKQFK